MGLQHLIKQIRAEVSVDIRVRAKEENFPSGLEPGFRHPQTGGYMLVRDDSVTEMGNGPNTAVIADGANQQVTVKANAISLHSRYLHFHTAPNGLYFGYQRLNPQWFSLPGDVISPYFRTAPVVQNFPGALEAAVFLTGTPAPGTAQVPVSLARYLRAQPFLLPNEQLTILGRNLAKMMSALTL